MLLGRLSKNSALHSARPVDVIELVLCDLDEDVGSIDIINNVNWSISAENVQRDQLTGIAKIYYNRCIYGNKRSAQQGKYRI